MDLKTLSTIIGHTSTATTLNVCTHITNEMQKSAAIRIDHGSAKAEVDKRAKAEIQSAPQEFVPYSPPRRRPGTCCITQINDHLWGGRYSPAWPGGKKHSRSVYGHTKEECEAKLKELIIQMKAEIAALRSGRVTEYPDDISPKKKQIAAYLMEHPGVSSKSDIARELEIDRTTVQKYYDEVRAELTEQQTASQQMVC